MKCFLAVRKPIQFSKDYPIGMAGKMGSVAMRYKCSRNNDKCYEKLSEALKSMLMSADSREIRVGVIMKEPQFLCQGVLQLVEEKGSFLTDVNTMSGVENVRLKVILSSQSRESSRSSLTEASPPLSNIFVSKEMIVGDGFEKTCEDNSIQFRDKIWYQMFKTRGETLTVQITIEMTINFSLKLDPCQPHFTSEEEKLHDKRNSYANIITKSGQCQNDLIGTCSAAFNSLFRPGAKINRSMENVEMTEEGVQSYLDYLFYQGAEMPNMNSDVALQLLITADMDDYTPNIDIAMSNIMLLKPASWYNWDVALKLFVFARESGRDELKMKAVQVLKHHSAALLISGEELFKENPQAALELCCLALSS